MELENDNNGIFATEHPQSKSALKREAEAIAELARALCKLGPDKAKQTPGSSRLLDALHEYQRCKGFGAQRRQMLYIAKLLRQEEHAQIAAWLQGESLEQKQRTLCLHAAENWRERLIASAEGLEQFIAAYPAAQQANLYPLIRQAAIERQQNKTPRNFRRLFQMVLKIIEDAT